MASVRIQALTSQKMKFFIKDFSSKCDQICRNPQETVDLVTFTGEILNGKLHFCAVSGLPIARQVNSVLKERVISLEHQCWSNSQYSKRKCLELTYISEISGFQNLVRTVLKIFERQKVKEDLPNIKDYHWICRKNCPKRVILMISKRKATNPIPLFKKNVGLTSLMTACVPTAKCFKRNLKHWNWIK